MRLCYLKSRNKKGKDKSEPNKNRKEHTGKRRPERSLRKVSSSSLNHCWENYPVERDKISMSIFIRMEYSLVFVFISFFLLCFPSRARFSFPFHLFTSSYFTSNGKTLSFSFCVRFTLWFRFFFAFAFADSCSSLTTLQACIAVAGCRWYSSSSSSFCASETVASSASLLLAAKNHRCAGIIFFCSLQLVLSLRDLFFPVQFHLHLANHNLSHPLQQWTKLTSVSLSPHLLVRHMIRFFSNL